MSNFISITEGEWELIEKYLANTLSVQEEADFRSREKVDAHWQQKVQQVQLTILGIGETVLTQKLEHFHKSVENKATLAPVKTTNWKKWLIAASVIIAVTLGGLLIGGTSANEKLFNAHYKVDPGLATFMGVSDNYEFENAMVDYKLGEYKKAVSAWQKMLKAHPANDTLNYFIGSALMADKNMKQAIPYFDKTISDSASAFKQDAQWYKSLALLYTGERQAAISLLEKTEQNQKDALLQKLKK